MKHCSPDLSPADYWFFAYVTRKVFSQLPNWPVIRPEDFFDLKHKLVETIRYINENEKNLIIRATQNFIVSKSLNFFKSFKKTGHLKATEKLKIKMFYLKNLTSLFLC